MMRIFVSLAIAACLLFSWQLYADDGKYPDKDKLEKYHNKGRIAPGMELKKVGDAHVLVPEGSELRREGDLLVVEGAGEYSARKFKDVDERFGEMESELEALRAEMAGIKKEIADLKKTRLISK